MKKLSREDKRRGIFASLFLRRGVHGREIQKMFQKISKFEKNFDKFSDKLLAKQKVICYNIIKGNSGFFIIL